jgi:hypothetical protein
MDSIASLKFSTEIFCTASLKIAVEMLAARERKEHKARNASKGRISFCSVLSFAANKSSLNPEP